MPTGTVIWFSRQKGYGFIKPDHPDEPDLFVHVSAVERSGLAALEGGSRVRFEVYGDRNGRAVADDIVIIGKGQ